MQHGTCGLIVLQITLGQSGPSYSPYGWRSLQGCPRGRHWFLNRSIFCKEITDLVQRAERRQMLSWLCITEVPILALTGLWHPAYSSYTLNYIFMSTNSLLLPLRPCMLAS